MCKKKLYIILRKHKWLIFSIFSLTILVLFILEQSLLRNYKKLESIEITDRHGKVISVLPNSKGEYSHYIEELPKNFKDILISSEDKYFYFHPGINLLSLRRIPRGSSTITQQLAKNLLGNENSRTVWNKLIEVIYAISLEIFLTKSTILEMYGNTVYLGNNIQGLGQASLDYFGRDITDLTESEFISLIATLPSPNKTNPWKTFPELKKKSDGLLHNSKTSFEFYTMGQDCETSCETTLDKELTEKLREILKKNVSVNFASGARNGAIVVIKVPENEIIAIVGSPNPSNDDNGHGINMAVEPRPIGSTIKPLIYLEAFEKGLRPYSLVLDREYKYPIGTGYPLYIKNYDGLYHGLVTLHEALSNSYNIPSVKTLEYIGLSDFYKFLEQKLAFMPIQDLDKYQYGIALGGLEIDPLTLAHFFTIFPNKGTLSPLRLYLNNEKQSPIIKAPMNNIQENKKVSDPKYTELVTKILNDRQTGVEQFGLVSSLNLTQGNYAVKTGTSRDYHDSWTIGYTPDYVVAVWLGNAENKPLEHVSGQSGAGQIWNESMELLINTEYNHHTEFKFNSLRTYLINGKLDIGLEDDVPEEHIHLLESNQLILSPHNNDSILLENNTEIPLKASQSVSWYANDIYIGQGEKVYWKPIDSGKYAIKAVSKDKKESLFIYLK